MVEKIKEDINFFVEQAEKLHINYYFLHSKEELNKYIDNYLSINEVNNKYDLIYMLKSINKYMLVKYDSHTNVIDNESIHLPLELKLIEDELYIDKCYDDSYKKANIISINNIPLKKITDELNNIICYGTNEWFKRCIELNLVNSSVLLSLPSVDSNSKSINFETNKGILKIDLDKEYNCSFDNDSNYEILNNSLIYKYIECTSENVPDINYIDEIIKNNNIEKFILDIRNNSGGNENLLLPLIEYLKNSNLDIYTVVNKGVFSSARINCIDMKNIGSKIISEDLNIGTPLNCFGSNNRSLPTPNFNLLLTFSKWYINYNLETKKIEFYKIKEEIPNSIEPIYLEIDKYIPITKEDYLNDIDITIKELKKNKSR